MQCSPTGCGARVVCELENLVNEEALAHWGAVAPKKKQELSVRIIKSAPKLERDGPAEKTANI